MDTWENQQKHVEEWNQTPGPAAWHRHWSPDRMVERLPGPMARTLMALGARSTVAGLLMVFLIPIGAMSGLVGGLWLMVVGGVIGWAIAFVLGRLAPLFLRLVWQAIPFALRTRRAFAVNHDHEMKNVLAGKKSSLDKH